MPKTTQDEKWIETYKRAEAKWKLEQMTAHIDEFQVFQELCTGRVHDDDRGIVWLTWCIRRGAK